MSTSAEQIRHYSGPAILSFGFRPLFLSAGLWAAIVMVMWVLLLSGAIDLPTGFSPVDWHIHELLYGYLPAVVAGFLLTAIPNWTGRLPVTGYPLLALTLCWWAGRFIVLFSGLLGATLTALVDLLFLALLISLIGREVIAGRNWRNLKMLVLVVLLFVGNIVFHVEAANGSAGSGHGIRIGIATSIFLIMLIGGRIIPSFTRNWLAKRASGRLPVSFNHIDKAALVGSAIALLSWVFAPESWSTLVLCLLAGISQLWRQLRWAPERTLAEPLVWVLHFGYAFIPIGFLLVAAAGFAVDGIHLTASLHAWTAGAIGVMTLAVMTRATLGHTGQQLTAAPATTMIYALAMGSALVRILAGTSISTEQFLHLAGALWVAAFIGFVIVFGPLLWNPRH